MSLLGCKNIKKEIGDKTILRDINFIVNSGDRIGIVGENGAGKTTLANIILGKINYTSGKLLWYKENIRIGYLAQSTYYSAEVINNLYNRESPIGDFLYNSSNMGLNHVDRWGEERFCSLSGGEKTKLALAEIWAQKPELLILDEPTNHLDIDGSSWLIEKMREYNGTVIVISHNRYFLDNTVTRIIEIDEGKAVNYKGNYSDYKKNKEHKYQSQLNAFNKQEKTKDAINIEISKLKSWSAKGHRESRKKAVSDGNKKGKKEHYRAKVKKKDKQIKSKIKRLEKIQRMGVAKPKTNDKINIHFNEIMKMGSRVIEAINISKVYHDDIIIKNSSFYIKRGEKVGLIGKNGCGKTTLINMILKNSKLDSGKLLLGKSARVAYMSQDIINIEKYITARDIFTGISIELDTKAISLLKNIGFTQDMLNVSINELSLGERTRLKIANLILQDNNVLILDEPTNHLDLNSREKLEDMLEEYEGTIIIASHDRYLLDRICSHVLEFKDHSIKRIEKSFREYMMPAKFSDEDLLVLDNRIAYLIGEISKCVKKDERYHELEGELDSVLLKKKEIQTK